MFNDPYAKKFRIEASCAQFLDNAEYEAEIFHSLPGGLRVQLVGQGWKLVRTGFGQPDEPTSVWAEMRDELEPVPWVDASTRRRAIRAAERKIEGDLTQRKYVRLLNHLLQSR